MDQPQPWCAVCLQLMSSAHRVTMVGTGLPSHKTYQNHIQGQTFSWVAGLETTWTMVAPAYKVNIWEAEAGGSQVWNWPVLYKETKTKSDRKKMQYKNSSYLTPYVAHIRRSIRESGTQPKPHSSEQASVKPEQQDWKSAAGLRYPLKTSKQQPQKQKQNNNNDKNHSWSWWHKLVIQLTRAVETGGWLVQVLHGLKNKL